MRNKVKETKDRKKRTEQDQKGLRGLKSMRLRVFLGTLVIGAVLIFLVTATIRSYFLDRSITSRIDTVKDYTDKLSNKMILNAYFAAGSDTADIDRELNTVSELYEGRIIVINGGLRIITDTFGAEVGKTLISSEAIGAIRGQANQYIDRNQKTVELTLPVTGKTVIDDEETEGSIGALILTVSIADVYDVLNIIDRRIAFVTVLLGAFLVIIAYFFSLRLAKPMKKIESSIRHVADGYLNDRIEVNDYSEVEGISDSLNEMLDRIRKMEESRQEFVSNVSHELKTPMTSIKVLADSLLSQEDAPAELYREFLGDIGDEIDRENRIITDLLALVKLDKKHADLHIEEKNVNELLEIILKRLKPLAKKRNIELIFESYRPVLAEVDEVKLSLALSNLIENAVKYNKDSGWVHVSLNSDHKYFFVKVADSGIGIPQESIDMIFDRFYRVDKARTRETGGTGLGLAITKSVVLMHKGSIKVYSEEDEGTTFTVRIPLSYIPEED